MSSRHDGFAVTARMHMSREHEESRTLSNTKAIMAHFPEVAAEIDHYTLVAYFYCTPWLSR